MPNDKPAPPANIKLSDLQGTKQRAQFISDFGLSHYQSLVSADCKARSEKAKADREAAMAQRRNRGF